MNRYQAIRDELIRRVNSGEWVEGMDLPHEVDLAQEFGVARGTVRRALSGLVEQGLVQRKRRAGSRVVARAAHASRLTIPVVRREIERRGEAYAHRLILRQRREGTAGFGQKNGVLVVKSLHLSDGKPFQFEDREINLDALPEAAAQDFLDASPNEWLVRVVPATEVETVLRADGADAECAHALALPRDAPVFVVERRTFLDGAALTRVTMSHPAAAYRIVTRAG